MDERLICSTPGRQFQPDHSRSSSNASITSSPVASTFPSRSHSRWPSSSSSFVTSPDSPVNVTKPSLHDLQEEPTEDESLCICDALFCEHQRGRQSQSAGGIPWSAKFKTCEPVVSYHDLDALPSTERRSSDPSSGQSLTTLASLTLSSLSRQARKRTATISGSNASTRSAPPSRSSSKKKKRPERQLSSSHVSLFSRRTTFLPIASGSESIYDDTLARDCSRLSISTTFQHVSVCHRQDPVEREELSATPLLPPSWVESRNDGSESPRSPLQSPSIAAQSTTGSVVGSPLMSPITQSFSSPALSTKPSFSSIGMAFSKCGSHISSDILRTPFIMAEEEEDEWCIKLGHANFHISPDPYMPTTSDPESCAQLLEDWKIAQVAYLRRLAQIGEDYGPTSRTYKLAGDKWDDIESQWRSNFALASDQARANGDTIDLEPLEAPYMLPDKFPDIDPAEVVGPMVQYSKISNSPTKKNTFLRLLTDATSILRKA